MKKNNVSLIIQGIVIIVLLYFFFNPEFLIPAGYNLAIDGIVVSRNLCLIAALCLIFRAGEQNFPLDR